MKFKVGDQVIVTQGKDKGKTGEITKVYPKAEKVTVKGANIYKRHIKSRDGIQGGIMPIERPLHTSSVAIIDPKTNKPTRIGYLVKPDGKKVRIAKSSGTELTGKAKTTKTKKSTKKEPQKPAKESKSKK